MKNYFSVQILLLVIVTLAPITSSALGKEYAPSNSDEVLVELPRNYSRYAENIATQEKAQLSERELASQIRYYLDTARNTGDERYLGYAYAIVEGIDTNNIESQELAIAYAGLLQREHHFNEALALLEQVLVRTPQHGQANLMAAYINITLGRADKAKQYCQMLSQSAGLVLSQNCLASSQILLGKVDASNKLLLGLLENSQLSAVEKVETLINLGEIAKLQGNFHQAEEYFKQILAMQPDNAFILMRLADTYIAAGKYDDCISLLNHRNQPTLQLRRAMASVGKSGRVDNTLLKSLDNYFEVQLARDPQLSSRDYAAYLLVVKNQPKKALEVSLKNWRHQREIADTELVLRAALHAEQIAEANEVVTWVMDMGLQDYDINRLLALYESE